MAQLKVILLIVCGQELNVFAHDSYTSVATDKLGKNPWMPADIVGRDLNAVGLSVLGHVGL